MLKTLFDHDKFKARKKVNPGRVIALGFLTVIFLGAALLSLPVSSRSGTPVPFLTALFTAVSATCVTGLTVVDTLETWSLFGKTVILLMIQIGGLGFMSVTTIFFFIMRRKINLSQRLLIMRSLNLKDVEGVVRLIRHVLTGTLVFEGLGALILWRRFLPEHGLWKGLGMGVFHSVSAFCNAGFDLMGAKGRLASLEAYSGDPAMALTVSFLVLTGGLGFFVWEDIRRNRRFKKLHLHSKMVLAVSFWLILFGWVIFYFSERTNPHTIGSMPFPRAALVSFFHGVTPRSGGFSLVNPASLTGMSKIVTMLLMFIGGSPGSTAGGIKNVTAGILFLSAIQSLKGKNGLTVFGRAIPQPQIISAMSIFIIALTASFAGTAIIVFIQPELPVSGVLFEMVSAVVTCGLSLGLTPLLSPGSMAVIMLFMFFGRVGIMAAGMAAFYKRGAGEKTRCPETWVMM